MSRWARSPWAWAAVALVLRSAFVLLEPAWEPMGDEPSWLALGLGLLRGRHALSPLRPDLIFYPPAYPYLVALTGLAGGLSALKAVQVVLSALLVPAVFRVARAWAGPGAGALAAALVAVQPELIWFSGHVWSETLFLALLWWGLERLVAGRPLAAGALLGLAALTRETALYFVPVAALLMLLEGEPGPRRLRPAAALLLACICVVGPWTLRNLVVFRAFVPVSTFGAFNLWLGNSRLPREEVVRLSDSVEGPIEQYRLASREARQAIASRQPRWILEKLRDEVPAFFEADSQVLFHLDQGAYGPVPTLQRRLVGVLVLGPYLALAGLALWGVRAGPGGPVRRLLLVFLAYYLALHVVAFGASRFRLPVLPVLCVLAGAALARREP